MSTTWIEEVLDRAQRALEKAGVARWEIAADEVAAAAIEAMDGKIHVAERSIERSVGIRVLDRGIGFVGLVEPNDADLERGIAGAREEARRARAAAIDDFAERAVPPASPQEDFFDPRATGELSRSLEIAALELEARALGAAPNIARVRPARIAENRVATAMRTSRGASARDRSTRAYALCGAVAEDDDDAQSAYGSDSAPAVVALDLDRTAREASEKASRMLGAGSFETARVPVLFDFEAAGELFALITSALEADRLERGASFLAGALGNRAFSEALTLIDDPHDAELDGSAWFDGEAVPTTRLVLVERGVVQNVLDDRDTAARAGRRATAHGLRESASDRPAPGLLNLAVLPGSEPTSALLARAEGGLWVHALSGTHTVNEVTGELSLGASGWAIRGGELAEPVEGAMVAGTLLGMLAEKVHLSSETRRIGAFRVPVMLIEDIQVSG